MNQSCHIWNSHVTYGWVVSRSHVTYGGVMSQKNGCYHIRMSRVTHEWVLSYMNEACHANDWVMLHLNTSYRTYTSHVTHQWVISHVIQCCCTWMSHITREWVRPHMHESCHIQISHVAPACLMLHLKESCHTKELMVYRAHLKAYRGCRWQVGVGWCGVGLLWHEVRCTCLLRIDTAHSMSCACRVHVVCISLSSSSIRLIWRLRGNFWQHIGIITLFLCAIIIWWQIGIIWV